MAKFIVTVHQVWDQSGPATAIEKTKDVQEIFKQGFDDLDLSKFVVALNQRPRGRPSKPAKKEAQP